MSVGDIDFGLELKKAYEHGYAEGKRDAVQWFSVEERLPEDGAIVLFATKNNPAVYRGRYIATGDKKAHYFTTRIGRANSGGTYSATHWMPLPELPKEEA